MQDETPPESKTSNDVTRRRSWMVTLLRPKFAIPIFLLLLLIASPFLIRAWNVHQVPNFPEPFDVEAFRNLTIPDEDNAFVEYRLASEMLVESDDPELLDQVERVLEFGWSVEAPAAKAWLEANQEGLELWKSGSDKPDALYVPPSEYHFNTQLHAVQSAGFFTRLALLQAEKVLFEETPSRSWAWYRMSANSSRHVGMRGGIIERLVGVAMLNATAPSMTNWSIDPRVTKQELLNARQELETIVARTPQPSVIFVVEYLFATNTIQEVMKSDGKVDFEDIESFPHAPYPRLMRWMIGEPDTSILLLNGWHLHQARFIDLPAYLRPEFDEYHFLYDDGADLLKLDRNFTPEKFRNALAHSLAGPFLPALNKSLKAYDRERVHFDCLRVALAAQAFHREHQRFPTELDELVPEYLPEVPIDWYSGDPLLYRLDADGAIVYSVYVDQFDDGGEEIGYTTEVRQEDRDPADFGIRIRTPGWRPLYAPRPVDFAVE